MTRRMVWMVSLFMAALTFFLTGEPNHAAASAGLGWGPVTVGNLKLYATNQHYGYAGPRVGYTDHINFHIDKANGSGYSVAANFHISKYQYVGSSQACMYVWESKSGNTVVDQCFTNFTAAAGAVMTAIKSFMRTVLDNANWLALVIIWAVVAVALIALIVSMATRIVPAGDPVMVDKPTQPVVEPTDDVPLQPRR